MKCGQFRGLPRGRDISQFGGADIPQVGWVFNECLPDVDKGLHEPQGWKSAQSATGC